MHDYLLLAVRRGSNVVGFRVRLDAFMAKDPIDIALANWLKEEYGLGGGTFHAEDGSRIYGCWDSKGIKITNWDTNEEFLFSWKKVADAFKSELKVEPQLSLF